MEEREYQAITQLKQVKGIITLSLSLSLCLSLSLSFLSPSPLPLPSNNENYATLVINFSILHVAYIPSLPPSMNQNYMLHYL